MSIIKNEVDLLWKNKYPDLKTYYNTSYDKIYFMFDSVELEIDPCESMESIESYDDEKQQKEIIKCIKSFPYFCHKYVKIAHPTRGLLPFILFNYQRRCVKEFEEKKYSIIRKFRQGGLTTVTVLWALWRCLFKLDETIMVLSKSDREAIAAGEIVKRAIEELPSWMRPDMDKNNDHQKLFKDTGCKLFFYTPEAARGRSITYLIIDEAAFVQNMEKYWKAMYPTLSAGGHCIAISTVNGIGNWYEETYHGAEKGDNDFNIIDLAYTEHPDYDDEEWVRRTRAQLGEKGWLQEVMGDFLGAGDTWIPPDVLNDYEQEIIRMDIEEIMFERWASKMSKLEATGRKEMDPGALYIWKKPIEGREYIIGVDAAEGIGPDGDNSSFQIIDVATCEQVGEFYSNTCPNHTFAGIVAQTGTMYNTALVVVENEKYGATIIDRLKNDYYYENLFETTQGKASKVGIKTTGSNRPLYLDAFRTRMLTKTIPLRSRRLIKELKTFVFNTTTKKAEAANGGHDDAIMAMCLALYARDQYYRQAPLGDASGDENSERKKLEMFAEIKAELERVSADDFDDDSYDNIFEVAYDDVPNEFMDAYKRPFEDLLREFGM